MSIVAVFTAIGLAAIGMPLWLVLALFAALVSFILNLGPVIALVPALLVGLMEGTDTALLVAGLYVLIQFIESNFITTTIHKKMVNLPPAMILIAQLIIGALTGVWGLSLATPLPCLEMHQKSGKLFLAAAHDFFCNGCNVIVNLQLWQN